jgi:DNA-binding MarR family transcriptional regulator
MDATLIPAVRRFNRFYTKRIGVLDEGLLGSPLSLAEGRVLYEIANRDRPTATEIRQALALDAGYLSRILRSLGGRRLVQRSRADDDGRRVHLTLTPRGRAAFAALNRRSDTDVSRMLRTVPAADRRRLVGAMRTIARVLGDEHAPTGPCVLRAPRAGDLGWIVHRHGALYAEEWRYDEAFEALVAEIVAGFVQHRRPLRERCWVADLDGEIVGSVFLVEASKTVAKLRLLYVEPSARGHGIGARLIDACVRFARRAGYRTITLWTQSELDAARRLYAKAGFTRTGSQRHNSFGRRNLVAEVWELKLSR